MAVIRIMPDLASSTLAETTAFYVDVLGLHVDGNVVNVLSHR